MLAQSGDFLGDLARLVFLLSLVLAPILKSRAEKKKAEGESQRAPRSAAPKPKPRPAGKVAPDQDFLDLDPWERMLQGDSPQNALPSMPEQEALSASPSVPAPAPAASVKQRAPQRQRMTNQPLSAPLSQTSEVSAPPAPRPVAQPQTIGAPLERTSKADDDHLGAHLPSEFRTRALPSQIREQRGERGQSFASELSSLSSLSSLSESTTAAPVERKRKRTDWRRAIVLSELVTPPVALRDSNAGIGAPPGLR